MKTKLRLATRGDIGKRVVVSDHFGGYSGVIKNYYPGTNFPWVVMTGEYVHYYRRDEFRVVETEPLVDKEYEDMLV